MKYVDYKDQTFAIVSNYGDMTNVVLATGLENALKSFLHSQNIVTSLFPNKELIITGQEHENNASLLNVFLGDQNLLSLQSVSYCDGTYIDDNGKEVPVTNTPNVDDCESFVELAYKLNKVYSFNSDDSRVEKRFQKVSRSWSALFFSRDNFTYELASFEEACAGQSFDFNVEVLSGEIDNINLSYSFTATLTEE